MYLRVRELLTALIATYEDSYQTKLGWLKDNNGRPSSDTFKKIIERLEYIRSFELISFSKPTDYTKLKKLLHGRINTKMIKENYDDVLRLAHSIREGVVSGSLFMGKLGSYARSNKVATALREMGRIEKTVFIFDYISDKALRTK